jgi:hypothetical protein
MRIYIPSLNRQDMMARRQGTVWTIPPTLRNRITLVLHSEEQRQLYAPHIPSNVEVIVSNLSTGLTETRYFIADLAERRKEELFVQIDDDLTFYERTEGTRLEKMQPETYGRMFSEIEEKLRNGYSMAGVSDRLSNHSNPAPYRENTFHMCVLAFRTDDFQSLERHNLPALFVREDMHLVLQLLERGKPNIRLYWCAQGDDIKERVAPEKGLGGCMDYRTREIIIESNKILHRLHPQFVTLLEDGFKTRTSWKKAYEYGRNQKQGLI